MAKPKRKSVTDVPLPPMPTEEGGLAPAEGMPDSPRGRAEWLRSLDPKDPKTLAMIGAAAVLVVGVGAYTLSKRQGGGKFFVGFADRRAEKLRVVTLGESVEYGAAVAVPVGAEGLKHLDQAARSGMLFAMTGPTEPGEVVRLSPGAEPDSKYVTVAQRAAGWLIDHFSSQADESK